MKLITFATNEEAKEALALFKAHAIKPGLYTSEIGLIAITGIGPFAAFTALSNLKESFDSVINIGLAGSRLPELEVGSIHSIALCKKYCWNPEASSEKTLSHGFADLTFATQGRSLTTLDFPLYAPNSNITSDLVDMEGYGIALAAMSRDLPCSLYKLVSDHCSKDSSSQMKNNIREYSHKIASFLKIIHAKEPL